MAFVITATQCDRSSLAIVKKIRVWWMIEIPTAAVGAQSTLVQASLNIRLDFLGAERSTGICYSEGWAISVTVDAPDMKAAWISTTKKV